MYVGQSIARSVVYQSTKNVIILHRTRTYCLSKSYMAGRLIYYLRCNLLNIIIIKKTTGLRYIHRSHRLYNKRLQCSPVALSAAAAELCSASPLVENLLGSAQKTVKEFVKGSKQFSFICMQFQFSGIFFLFIYIHCYCYSKTLCITS